MNIGDLDFGYGGDNLFDPGVFKTNLPGQGSKLDYSWFDPNISAGAADTFASSKKSGINWGDVATGFLDQLDQSRSSGGGGGGYQPSSFYMMSPSSNRESNNVHSSGGEEREIGNNIFEKGGPKEAYFFPRGTGGSNIYSLRGGIGSPVQQPKTNSFGLDDVAQLGMRYAGNKLMNTALAAVPGVGTALAAVNTFYPGGITEAAKDVSRFAGDAIGGLANIAGDVVGGIGSGIKSVIDWFCDERLKVDIAPLETTEVNDELAQMAFFVKGLRECS